jgi:hypothetical protein
VPSSSDVDRVAVDDVADENRIGASDRIGPAAVSLGGGGTNCHAQSDVNEQSLHKNSQNPLLVERHAVMSKDGSAAFRSA